MERHLATSPVSMGARRKDAPNEVSVWTHTLILTGELTHRSAHTLEMEIERLCGEGVTGITLDLRQLTSIDSIGAAVIAFRWGLCQRRGYSEQAGLSDVLPFQVDEVTARRLKKPIRRRQRPSTTSLAHDGQ
jgi:ABC-type transporter Mla MlaB component